VDFRQSTVLKKNSASPREINHFDSPPHHQKIMIRPPRQPSKPLRLLLQSLKEVQHLRPFGKERIKVGGRHPKTNRVHLLLA
jgi:hypothetical protein